LESKPIYKRIVVKLSGEALQGEDAFGISPPVLGEVAGKLIEVAELGVECGVVIGGGNIFRGVSGSAQGMDRAGADYMGMLATVVNSLALQDALERMGLPTRVMTALRMTQVAEPYIRRRAIRHLEKGRLVILAAGTGNPYFTTDTAATLRAAEIGAQAILKATRVDGVYDSDPLKNPEAKRFDTLSYREAIERNLRVMDVTAISMAMENRIPVIVFDLRAPSSIKRVVMGENIGTTVSGERTGG